LLCSCSVTPVHAALSWNVQTADENASAYFTPIAVDSNNTAHIAYTAIINGGNFVMYASWNGSGFSTQAIGTGQGPYSVVLDANDNPHVLYGIPDNVGYPVDRNLNPLGIATWSGGNWVIQNTNITDSNYATLALDSFGNPHIAYLVNNELEYAILTGTNWSIQTVDNLPQGSGLSSLVFDSNNTPYILYSTPSFYQDKSTGLNYTSTEVKLAILRNSTWNIQIVPLPKPIYDNSNLVLDSKGNPQFICTHDRYVNSKDVNLIFTVLYVSWDGSVWKTQAVASNLRAVQYGVSISGSLCLDSKDNPHISSFIGGTGSITYTVWTGKTWESQNVALPPPGPAIGPCNLALDSNGNPHISFSANSGIRYITPVIYATATETT
jgi:hypothetical protein